MYKNKRPFESSYNLEGEILLSGRLKDIYEFLSLASRFAYKDIYLVTNQVLSKNPFTNNFLKYAISGKKPASHRFVTKIFILVRYYIKSFVRCFFFFCEYLQYEFSGTRFSASDNKKEIIVIDTFFLVDAILQSEKYKDSYLKGLDDILRRLNKNFVYLLNLPRPRKSFKIYRTIKILEKENVPLLTEYQLLTIWDILRTFVFIAVYPFHVFKFISCFQTDATDMKDLLKHTLVDTLDTVTFYDYLRYLQGRRISLLPYEKIKLVGWFENQSLHKCLYRGLREENKKTVIYGAQLFLYSSTALNLIVDEEEVPLGVVPDKILTNGSYYIPKVTCLNYIVGPSLRYGKIFTTVTRREKQRNILILLPYYDDDVKNILTLLGSANLPGEHLILKSHPATSVTKFAKLIPEGVKINDDDTYSLFEISKIVISSASGVLIEAVSLGIPVISVKNTERFDYNPLPDYGKGIVWDEVTNSEELNSKTYEFLRKWETNYEEIMAISHEYKEMFFSEPTEQNIIKAFDLHDYNN